MPLPNSPGILHESVEFSQVGYVVDKFHRLIAVVGSLAEPDTHISCLAKNLCHAHHLLISLLIVILTDA
jgi:hypothetical protein